MLPGVAATGGLATLVATAVAPNRPCYPSPR